MQTNRKGSVTIMLNKPETLPLFISQERAMLPPCTAGKKKAGQPFYHQTVYSVFHGNVISIIGWKDCWSI